MLLSQTRTTLNVREHKGRPPEQTDSRNPKSKASSRRGMLLWSYLPEFTIRAPAIRAENPVNEPKQSHPLHFLSSGLMHGHWTVQSSQQGNIIQNLHTRLLLQLSRSHFVLLYDIYPSKILSRKPVAPEKPTLLSKNRTKTFHVAVLGKIPSFTIL